jgi:Flp pilus assembly protein TadD
MQQVLLPGKPADAPVRMDKGRPSPPSSNVEEYAAKIRELQKLAHPRPKDSLAGLGLAERTYPDLAAALGALNEQRSAARLIAVAQAYRVHGVLDKAYEYFNAAVALDPRSAEAHDGLARLWRDWGFAPLALSDAYRALSCAPQSPATHNTLGTILLALGQLDAASTQFETAIRLDARASYALNNLCYLRILRSDTAAAVDACNQALALAPDLSVARNNLAIALAVEGKFDAAESELARLGDGFAVHYNTGLMRLVSRQFGLAAAEFDAAARLRPSSVLAQRRAIDAQRRASDGRPGPGAGHEPN